MRDGGIHRFRYHGIWNTIRQTDRWFCFLDVRPWVPSIDYSEVAYIECDGKYPVLCRSEHCLVDVLRIVNEFIIPLARNSKPNFSDSTDRYDEYSNIVFLDLELQKG